MAPAPIASALHGTAQPSVVLCGIVENEAGWPLEGVRVTAFGRGLTNADHVPRPTNFTDADGRFRLVLLADFYRILFDDPAGRDARAGAVYTSTEREVLGHSYTDGPCDAPQGIRLDPVVLQAPLHGFLEVPVTGAIDGAPLAEATVEARLLGTHAWGSATTDDDGVARISCPLHVPLVLHGSAAHHGSSEVEATCTEILQDAALALWRTPVAVTGALIDASTMEPVLGATVTATPQTLVLPDDHPYVLESTSGADGYALALPWADTYDATIGRGGYAPQGFEAAVTADDIAAGINESFVLERATATFAGTVTDITGNGLGATVAVTGPSPATDTLPVPVDADGTFSTELPVGEYDVSITMTGKNSRACSLVLPYDTEASLDPGCLVLVSDGKGAVIGTVHDGLTDVPLPDVTVTAGTSGTTTGPDGTFALEVVPGSTTVAFTRDHFATTEHDVDVAGDQVVVLSDVSVARETVTKTVRVIDAADNATVADTVVCPRFLPAAGEPVAHECKVTDATGEATFDLQWTSIGGDYDIGDYAFTGERVAAVPFFANETCLQAVDIDLDDLTTPSDCTLHQVPALATPIGPLVDAHDDALVADVQVTTALPGDVPCAAPYLCEVMTGPNGTATLLLPAGFSFDLQAAHGSYSTLAAAEDVAGGAAAFDQTALVRTAYEVLVHVTDAHTDLPLAGVAVDAAADFACDPDGSFVCSAVSDDTGAVLLSLPWGDLALDIPDGSFDVVRDAGFGDIETGVGFYGADLGVVTLPGVGEHSAALLRTPAEPLTIDVAGFDGLIVPGATLTIESERFGGFTCDPVENDGREPGYAACDAALDASSGVVALSLPDGTADDHTWSLRVDAPDHFREDRFGVPGASTLEVALWPLRFDLVVDPVDATSQETAPLVVVCIRNIDSLGVGSGSLPSEACKSSGVSPQPLVFEDVLWRRTAEDDTTDRFMVRAAGTFHLPSTLVVAAGPAAREAPVALVPLNPTLPEPEASLIPGRVIDRDANAVVPGDGVGVVGAHVFAVASAGCMVGSSEGASTLDGTFQVPVFCHGEHEVSVADARYEATAPQDVTVPTAGPLVFALDRVTRAVTVTVQDATTAAPVADAMVQLTGIDVTASASGATGADGTVTFDLPWGSYALAASGPAETAWVLGDATSVVVVSHVADAEAEVRFVSLPPLPTVDGCADDDRPDLCAPEDDDGSVVLQSVGAQGADGAPLAGNWLVVPPQVGAVPLVGVGSGVSPGAYTGPHGGTWTVVYTPPSMAGLTGVPPFPIDVRLAYTVDGVDAVATATLQGPVLGASPFVSPALTWSVNLHTGRSISCVGPQVTCDGAPADLAEAQAARFFTL